MSYDSKFSKYLSSSSSNTPSNGINITELDDNLQRVN